MTLRIDHWGTFEVANFGDLLYPLVLEHAVRAERPDATIRLTGPLGGEGPMGLGRPVRRAVRHDEEGFWLQAADVDGIVLGGGDILHHGTCVVRTADGLSRIDNWPFAVEAGLLAEVRPMAWNAVGVPFDIPDDLVPALRAACASIDLLAVRDEGSRRRLEQALGDREIVVAPDSGVLLDEVITTSERAGARQRMQQAGALPPDGSYLVVHVSFVSPAIVAELAGAVRVALDEHPDLEVVLLAIGPTHGDAEVLAEVATLLERRSWPIFDPTITEVAAVIDGAAVVASSSFHAALVAAAFDVPAVSFFHGLHRPEKQRDLSVALGRERWLVDRPADVAEAIKAIRQGEGAPDRDRVRALQAAARTHLRRVVEVVSAPPKPGVDLAERTAAHRHLVEPLRSWRLRDAAHRGERLRVHEHLRQATRRAEEWEAAYWRTRDDRSGPAPSAPDSAPVLDLHAVGAARLEDDPYHWCRVGPLFAPDVAQRLSQRIPLADAELREGRDRHRSWRYFVRPLVAMGASSAARPAALDPLWRALAAELAGQPYREALSALTGVDLTGLDLEANVFSYPPGSFQEPHPDLPEKIVTHVLWFNEGWDASYGGCLRILRSNDEADVAHELLPELGWSAVFVRSERSWHSVTAIVDDAPLDRRAVVATFYRPGSTSTMFPPG
jgi:hypothetical protein